MSKASATDLYAMIQDKLPVSARKWFKHLKDHGYALGRTGFYIGAYDVSEHMNPILICIMLIGVIENSEKREENIHFVKKKCGQLEQNPGHISSAQSANTELKKYTGGVRSDPILCTGFNIVIIVSGLDPLEDEFVAAEGGVDCGLIEQFHGLFAIAEASNNDLLRNAIGKN